MPVKCYCVYVSEIVICILCYLLCDFVSYRDIVILYLSVTLSYVNAIDILIYMVPRHCDVHFLTPEMEGIELFANFCFA